jgi:uncharacterized protein YxeA
MKKLVKILVALILVAAIVFGIHYFLNKNYSYEENGKEINVTADEKNLEAEKQEEVSLSDIKIFNGN